MSITEGITALEDVRARYAQLDRLQYIRKGMNTRRWHTEPAPVGREDTVAHHSCGVALLILTLHPFPSLPLIQAALEHDLPEGYTGDIPAPAKWHNDDLRADVEALEQKVRTQWELTEPRDLSESDQQWLRGCDALDALMFCEEQVRSGNRPYHALWLRMWRALQDQDLPMTLRVFLEVYADTYTTEHSHG